MTTPPLHLGALWIGLAVVLVTSACGMSVDASGGRDEARRLADALVADGFVLDLSAPLVPGDLGLVDGARTSLLAREDGQPFTTTVVLPDGQQVVTDAAREVRVRADGDGRPSAIDVALGAFDPEAGAERLTEDALGFGADPEQTRLAATDLQQTPGPGVTSRLVSADVGGGWTVEVAGFAEDPDDPQVRISWTFSR